MPPCYSIPALSLGWPTWCRRPALTRTSPHQHCRWRPAKGGRQLPTTRGLVRHGLLVRRLQERFRTRPGGVRLTRVEQRGCWVNKACQVSRKEIALRLRATGADMPALAQALRGYVPTGARLAQLGSPGIDRDDRPASTCSQAGQPLDKHSRRTHLDRAAL